MKRGLWAPSAEDVPDGEWAQRVSNLQARLVADDIDMLLIYGSVASADDISYLTNLCIYWNEGVLAVAQEGEATFLTKLSPRVHPWMRRTSTLSDLRSGRSFGELVASHVTDRSPGVVGFVDGQSWPKQAFEEVSGALAGWQIRRLGPMVADLRAVPSPAELQLLRTAGAIAGSVLAHSVSSSASIHERVADLERGIRGAGFADVFMETRASGDGTTSIGVRGQYRQIWAHCARLVSCPSQPTWVATMRTAFDGLLAKARGGVSDAALSAAAASHLDGLPDGAVWMLRSVDHTQLATAGELLPADPDRPHPTGSVVAVSLEVFFEDMTSAVLADTVLLGSDGAEVLTTAQSPDSATIR